MKRDDALEELQGLAVGLTGDDEGRDRLLERVSQAEEPEALRALLAELGAESLLRPGSLVITRIIVDPKGEA